jgi:RsiW-degrading membrane proteinase PrsW (M82 family)/ribosomal protein S18 acetylase RimI-like enzyme
MNLIALAIAPGLAISVFIFHRDAYNKEPKFNLVVAFLLGALSIFPAAIVEVSAKSLFTNNIGSTAFYAYAIVAMAEETSKFLVLRYYALTRKSFDEPLDGIVYSVIISMGFASLENIDYVTRGGIGTGILRMFLSVPAHASFAVLMGYYAGKAKFDPARRKKLLLNGLLWAVFFHGTFDFFLFLQGNPSVAPYISDFLLFAGAVASFITGLRLGWRHISEHRLLSQQTYRPTETLSIRKASSKDVPLIKKLADEVWPQTYAPILSKEQIDYMMNMMYSEESLQQQMLKNEFIIVYNLKIPVGFASFSLMEPGIYKLHKIYVLANQQGKGTGKYLIDQLVNAMKIKGATALRLNVNRFNKSQGFYEKMGFNIINEEKIDIGNGYIMDDYVMEKKLVG